VDPGYYSWFFNYTSAEGKGQSHKTFAYSLTMNTLLQQLQGGRETASMILVNIL
jgi:hypothetical protein